MLAVKAVQAHQPLIRYTPEDLMEADIDMVAAAAEVLLILELEQIHYMLV